MKLFITQKEGSFTLGKYTEPVPTYPLNVNRDEMATTEYIEKMDIGVEYSSGNPLPYVYPT